MANSNVTSDELRFWLNTVNVVDLAGNCFAVVLICCSLYSLLRQPPFHVNLIVLVTNVYILGLMICVGGCFKCIAGLIDFYVLSKYD